MSIQLSTATRNAMTGTTGFKGAHDHGVIEIYTGPQPVNADAAVQGTLLGTFTLDAGAFTPGSNTNGLTFDAPVAGVVSKAAAENWQLVATAAGAAGWFRLKGNAVDAGSGGDSTHYRMDGSIGVSGADMNLANITFEVGTPVTCDVFQFTLPAS